MSRTRLINALDHHAYTLIGSQLLVAALINELETIHGIAQQGNPDFFSQTFQTFTIEDARHLKAAHDMKPVVASAKKIFIITMNSATVEAQNALLKLLEEPAAYAHFFLIIPSEHMLLPTVLSRVQVIRSKYENDSEYIQDARRFLKMSAADRMKYIADMMEAIAKEKKSKQDAIIFLNALESVIYSDIGITKGALILTHIEKARNYSTDRAPSLKMLLEYSALHI